MTTVFSSSNNRHGTASLSHRRLGCHVFFLQPISWAIIVRPVREHAHRNGKRPILRSWTLSARIGGSQNGSRVFSATSEPERTEIKAFELTKSPSHLHESPLGTVMQFLPLQQAWGEYCRKALCIESFQFLVAVSEFQSLVHATPGSREGNDEFEEFINIVNEYIRVNSSSEINIDSSIRRKLLEFHERSAYFALSTESREHIFLRAEKEISKMLAENLLSKFKATDEYKEVADELIFEAK
ncbi:unnamed protein product [Ectocarpus fasciculatus]